VRGFADLHTHQFANLAFGGLAVAGSASGAASTALRWCDDPNQHGAGGLGDIMGNLIRNSLTGELPFGHHVGGYPQFDGWPVANSVSHQTMWEEWLERAHRGGLQLMVMHAVNNEHFCKNARQAPGRSCNDQEAIALQLQAARDFEAYIDGKSGGPGAGWYRIVYSPEQARAAIARGQLAVVLGIEVDDPFPCSGGSLPCIEAGLTRLNEYYASGVRHMFPIHFVNNSAGGASFDKVLTVPRGTYVDPTIGKLKHPYEVDVRDCKAQGYLREGGLCNAIGLTQMGAVVVRRMMNLGMLLETDHMSDLSFRQALSLSQSASYPVVSGHTGFVELGTTAKDHEKANEGNLTRERLDMVRQSGGMVATIANQGSLDEIISFDGGAQKIEHTCGNSSETLAQAILYVSSRAPGMPVALATDMNAFFPMPGPRFGSKACPRGKSNRYGVVNQGRVVYPFRALANDMLMEQSLAVSNDPAVTRTFDFNLEGLAHIGMLPDLIEDLRVLGVGSAALDAVMASAEGYIRVWELSVQHRLADEPTTCAGLRSEEGVARGKFATADRALSGLGEIQKACQAGTDDGIAGGGRKPKQCVDAEDRATRAMLTKDKAAAAKRLEELGNGKLSAGCWY
jgi:microsomal dipeptidase-like Zn-dependent dipeptidase